MLLTRGSNWIILSLKPAHNSCQSKPKARWSKPEIHSPEFLSWISQAECASVGRRVFLLLQKSLKHDLARFLVVRITPHSRMWKEMAGLNLPTQQGATNHQRCRDVEVSAAGGRREASRLKRGTKPYERPIKSKNSLNHSQEDDFLSSYSNMTTGQIVRKFGKINSTRIVAFSPAGKSQRRLPSSKSSNSCLKRRRGADQNSIVKDVNHQKGIERERKWKKLGTAHQRQTTQEKAKIKYGQQGKTYLECAIDEVMREFQKITIRETWQSWKKDEIL